MVFLDTSMNEYTIKAAGIFDIYMNNHMIISREAYLSAFGKEPINNTVFVHLNNADRSSLKEQLGNVDGIEKIITIEEEKDVYKSYASLLDFVTLLLTIMAGMMAYFILLNNVNMYVNQKKKELVIMRVNGFTVREIIAYVSYELIASTAAGIIFGLGTGSLLAYKIITLMETDSLHLLRSV